MHQALAGLKSSGDYARIVGEVQAEIEEENKAELARLAAAEKAQQEAEERAAKAKTAREEADARAKAAKAADDKRRAEQERERAKVAEERAKKEQKEAEAKTKEHEEIRKTRDSVAKAVESSSGREVTYAKGIGTILTTASHEAAFRETVTGPGIKPYLPMSQQPALARRLVELAKAQNRELTAAFIRENITGLVLGFKTTARRLSEEDKAALEAKDLTTRATNLQHDFARGVAMIQVSATKLDELYKKFPKGLAFPVTGEFRRAVDALRAALKRAENKL